MASNQQGGAAVMDPPAKDEQPAQENIVETLVKKIQALQEQQSRLADQLQRVANGEARTPDAEQPTLTLVNDSFKPLQALRHINDVWAKDAHREAPKFVTSKTYLVEHLPEKGAAKLPNALISNCEDASAARSYYWRRLTGGKAGNCKSTMVTIERHSEPADPASAAADAA